MKIEQGTNLHFRPRLMPRACSRRSCPSIGCNLQAPCRGIWPEDGSPTCRKSHARTRNLDILVSEKKFSLIHPLDWFLLCLSDHLNMTVVHTTSDGQLTMPRTHRGTKKSVNGIHTLYRYKVGQVKFPNFLKIPPKNL